MLCVLQGKSAIALHCFFYCWPTIPVRLAAWTQR